MGETYSEKHRKEKEAEKEAERGEKIREVAKYVEKGILSQGALIKLLDRGTIEAKGKTGRTTVTTIESPDGTVTKTVETRVDVKDEKIDEAQKQEEQLIRAIREGDPDNIFLRVQPQSRERERFQKTSTRAVRDIERQQTISMVEHAIRERKIRRQEKLKPKRERKIRRQEKLKPKEDKFNVKEELIKAVKSALNAPSRATVAGVKAADKRIGGFLGSRKIRGETISSGLSKRINQSQSKTQELANVFVSPFLTETESQITQNNKSQSNSNSYDFNPINQSKSQNNEHLKLDKLFERQFELEKASAEKTKQGALLLGSGAKTGVLRLGKEIIEKPTSSVITIGALTALGAGISAVTTTGVTILGGTPQVVSIAGKLAPEVAFGIFTAVQVSQAEGAAAKAEVLGTDLAIGTIFFGGQRALKRFTPRGQGKTVLEKLGTEVPGKIEGETSFSLVREIDEVTANTRIIKEGRERLLKDEFLAGRSIIDVAKPEITTFRGKDITGIRTPAGIQYTTQKVRIGLREFFVRTETSPIGRRITRVFKGDKEIFFMEDTAKPDIFFTEELKRDIELNKIKSSSDFDDTPNLREFLGETEQQITKYKGISGVAKRLLAKTIQFEGRGITLRSQKRGIRTTTPGLEIFRSAKTGDVIVKDIGTEFEFVDYPTRAKERILSVSALEIDEVRSAEFESKQIEKLISKFEIDAFIDDSIIGEKLKKGAKIKSKKAQNLLTGRTVNVEVQRPQVKTKSQEFGLVLTPPDLATTKLTPIVLTSTDESLPVIDTVPITDTEPIKDTIIDIKQDTIMDTKKKQVTFQDVKQLRKQLRKQKSKSKTLTETQQLTKQLSKLQTKQLLKQLLVQKTMQKTRLLQRELTKRKTKTLTFNVGGLKRTRLAPPLSLRAQLAQAFQVQVRRKGKFETLPGRFSKETALSKGARAVLGSSAATFRLKAVFGKPQDKQTDRFFRLFQLQFRRAKTGKLKSPAFQEFIEKSKYRINTLGELREITFKGIQEKKRKGKRRSFNPFGRLVA
jgi:hypothetical protein